MTLRYCFRYQTGALRLRWTFALVALFTFCAMAALFALRYQRNLFAESWQGLKASVAHTLPAMQAQPSVPSGADIRRCRVNGMVLYSNTECRADAADAIDSRAVVLHDSKGLGGEAAPVQPPAVPKDVSGILKNKLLEQ